MKLKMLVLTYYMSVPPISGGIMRIVNPLIELGKKGDYEFTLLFRSHNYLNIAQISSYFEKYPFFKKVAGVKDNNASLDSIGFTPSMSVPKDVFDIMSAKYRDMLVEVLKEETFDIVQVEHSQLAWVAPYIRKYNPKAKVVLDLHNLEYLLYKRRVENGDEDDHVKERIFREWIKMESWEKTVFPWFDYCLSVSPIESQMFSQMTPQVPVEDIPTGGGMDLNRFPWVEEFNGPKRYDLVYVGTMQWYPNAHGLRWFIDHVFPIVKRVKPECRLHIVGFGRPEDNLVQKAKQVDGVHFMGEQKDELEFFYNCSAFIVPLFIAAGARVKIVSAWAAGSPVISTSIGAEGLDYQDKQNILIADEAEDFANAVIKLMDDRELARTLRKNARNTVEKNYSLKYAAEKLDRIYKELVRGVTFA